MKKTFTVASVPGSKRTSERIYTHAIVAEYDTDAYQLDLPERLKYAAATAKSSFEHSQKLVQLGVGGTVHYKNNGRDFSYTVSQEYYDKAVAELEKVGGSVETVMEQARTKEIEYTKKRIEQMEGSHVLQWSMSHANAVKGMSPWQKSTYKNVRVEPVIEVAKKAKG